MPFILIAIVAAIVIAAGLLPKTPGRWGMAALVGPNALIAYFATATGLAPDWTVLGYVELFGILPLSLLIFAVSKLGHGG